MPVGYEIMQTLELKVPDGLLALLRKDGQPVERSILELMVTGLHARRIISAGRAAELLSMEEFAYIRYAGSLGIPYFDLTKEELEAELRVLDTLEPPQKSFRTLPPSMP